MTSTAPGHEPRQLVLGAIQEGLPLVARPYEAVARRLGLTEREVLSALEAALGDGTIRRLGVVVRHHELGYAHNAMCVWDVPDALAPALGRELAAHPGVTLCYRRRRSPPRWPFNLYCMVHGKDRADAEKTIAALSARFELQRFESKVLFSTRRFKQRGARPYADESRDRFLVRELQHGLEVCERPLGPLAAELGVSEARVAELIEGYLADGRLSRFGPLFNVERFGGVFVLAALTVPSARFEEVAALVNACPEVAHNYEREHALNMWFVVATETPEHATRVLRELEARTGLKVYAFPKEREFFLELKFPI